MVTKLRIMNDYEKQVMLTGDFIDFFEFSVSINELAAFESPEGVRYLSNAKEQHKKLAQTASSEAKKNNGAFFDEGLKTTEKFIKNLRSKSMNKYFFKNAYMNSLQDTGDNAARNIGSLRQLQGYYQKSSFTGKDVLIKKVDLCEKEMMKLVEYITVELKKANDCKYCLTLI